MKPLLGWALSAALLYVGWGLLGWHGVALAVSAIAFALMLQFNRAVRLMKNAADAPLGVVPNAVMFHAGLRAGLTMLQVVATTKTLGRKLDAASDDDWAWSDDDGSTVRLHFERGRLLRWHLERPN